MKDTYKNITELKQHHIEGKDFEILTGNKQKTAPLLLALHGGGIEIGTEEIVKALAKEDFPYYIFAGRMPQKNRKLHISSTNFDDPLAQKMAKQATFIISFHGCNDEISKNIDIGGSNQKLTQHFYTYLQQYSKQLGIGITQKAVFLGTSPHNIANLNNTGIQIEIPRRFRNKVLSDKQLFETFIEILKSYLTTQINKNSNI